MPDAESLAKDLSRFMVEESSRTKMAHNRSRLTQDASHIDRVFRIRNATRICLTVC
jgi:hypothetical protein